jgi:beta-N-acetylhexosaminidase
MDEMAGIASRTGPLAGRSLERAMRAQAVIGPVDDIEETMVRNEFANYFEAVA